MIGRWPNALVSRVKLVSPVTDAPNSVLAGWSLAVSWAALWPAELNPPTMPVATSADDPASAAAETSQAARDLGRPGIRCPEGNRRPRWGLSLGSATPNRRAECFPGREAPMQYSFSSAPAGLADGFGLEQ